MPLSRTARAARTLSALRTAIPEPETELAYRNPYELLVAVILSAQCTDARVNLVTPALFEAYPSAARLAQAEPEEVFRYVKSVSYPNNKSKHLVGMARRVEEHYGGAIPETLDGLQTLPGVGRKTALVVGSVAFGLDAIAVDTHVYRVAHRIGLVKRDADTPAKVEKQLGRVLPREDWSEAHHLLILHGRYTCTARSPKCDRCSLTGVCLYYERLQRLPAPRTDLDAGRGRYFCATQKRYFDEADTVTDRHGTPQTACPSCGSMNVFLTKTGETTKQVPDFRV
jgi:endonuclease-3